MALPHKLKAFQLFVDGGGWINEVPSLTLPELSRNLTAYQGGGMAGPVQVDLGQEEIEFSWTTPTMRKEAFATYASPEHDAAQLRFEGSYESDEDGSTLPVRVTAHGRYASIGSTEASAGEDNEGSEWTMTASYYKLEIDGSAVIEIDMVAGTVIVNGEDRTAQRRQNIGMI